eukprot:11154436-Lingulodinium_polyedra.AAC.1
MPRRVGAAGVSSQGQGGVFAPSQGVIVYNAGASTDTMWTSRSREVSRARKVDTWAQTRASDA